MEKLIVLIVVIMAAGYIIRRFYQKIKKGSSCDCQSCSNGCTEKD